MGGLWNIELGVFGLAFGALAAKLLFFRFLQLIRDNVTVNHFIG